MKLYELTGQYSRLMEMGEEIDADTLKDTLEGIEGEISDKAESIVKVMKSIEADEQAIKAEEDRLCARRKALENRRLSIKDYLEVQLISAKIDKITGTIFTIALQNNPPSVVIAEQAKVPKKYYIKQEPKLDKTMLKEAIMGGRKIKGVELKQTKSLRIR